MNCENLKIYGHAGVAQPGEGMPHYLFENCDNFLFALMNDQPTFHPTNKEAIHVSLVTMVNRYVRGYYFLKEMHNGKVIKTPPLQRAVLYIRGKKFDD